MKQVRRSLLACLTLFWSLTSSAQVLIRTVDTPATIVVFSAFACPFCQQARIQIDDIAKQYAGRVQIVFKHFPLGNKPSDFLPHELVLAASAQGKFREAHDVVFDLIERRSFDLDTALMKFKSIDLNVDRIRQEVESGAWRIRIEDDMAEAKAYRVVATPTFYVDGYKLEGLQSRGVLEQVLDFRIAQTQNSRKPNLLEQMMRNPANTKPFPYLGDKPITDITPKQ